MAENMSSYPIKSQYSTVSVGYVSAACVCGALQVSFSKGEHVSKLIRSRGRSGIWDAFIHSSGRCAPRHHHCMAADSEQFQLFKLFSKLSAETLESGDDEYVIMCLRPL